MVQVMPREGSLLIFADYQSFVTFGQEKKLDGFHMSMAAESGGDRTTDFPISHYILLCYNSK